MLPVITTIDQPTPTTTTTPTPERSDFITTEQLMARLPVCSKTLRNWRVGGKLPYIALNGKRCMYHWPSVQASLLRAQRGGGL